MRTRAALLVVHRKTGRAFSYNSEYELLEPLIVRAEKPAKFKSCRCFWKPCCQIPRWAWGVRDTEFDVYWL
jgi:hypothetical protein